MRLPFPPKVTYYSALTIGVVWGCTEPPAYIFPGPSGDADGADAHDGLTTSPTEQNTSGLGSPRPGTSTTTDVDGGTTLEFDLYPTTDRGTTGGGSGPITEGTAQCHVHARLPEVISECVAIGATVYTWTDDADGGTSQVGEPRVSGKMLCFEGHAGQVMNDEYDVTYGAGLGIYLAQPAEDGSVIPFDAVHQGFDGVRFSTPDSPYLKALRAEVTVLDPHTGQRETYCNFDQMVQPGINEVWFDQMYRNCWEGHDDPLDPRSIEAIQWHMTTNASYAFDFSACVGAIEIFYRVD